ncbi:DUF2079 domain-containing protein [Leptospira kanakyensis]|uniref:DUF2079 domain-containing protein n=1 Tax=Leptospira kanakyensis TaxID=2484968 RepID=A0A6N4PYE1_9LEPT|nr:DUF2079 domain-containing protein [Leptospira kanakyensis]TGK50687.1 DUF2079 domain-containing protein [Leptospira kanakyensis]TGK63712.1 DUF2079 domain-containing protein [Leptospira kanakyensis]TGK69825.1 DUF2079 domain-containing protein [Leptospira kanakyensis]
MKQLRFHLPSFIIWMVVFYFLTERSIFRYQHLGAGVDVGLFENLFYNLVHSGKAVTSIGIDGNSHHYFSDHINWYIYPLSILYKFFPYVESLLIFQALVISLPILFFPLYKKDNQNNWIYPLLYALFLPIYWIQVFDFHPEVLWIPLFFLFYYFWKKQSPYWILFFILSLLTKEESALVWIVFALIEGKSKKKESISIGLTALVYFIFCIILLSHLRNSGSQIPMPAHWERYENPIAALQNLHLFLYLILFLNLPFLFLQFRNKLILCLVPYFLYSLFSSYEVNKTPFTHHSFIAVPIIMISFIESLDHLNQKNKILFGYLSLFVSILIFCFFGPISKSYSYRKEYMNPGGSPKDVTTLRGLLNGKSVVSNLPQYLSNRTSVQLFLPNQEYTADYLVYYVFSGNSQTPPVPNHYEWEQMIENHIQIYKRTEN